MKYYLVKDSKGDLKLLTPIEELAEKLVDDDGIIMIHDTENCSITFDDDKIITTNKLRPLHDYKKGQHFYIMNMPLEDVNEFNNTLGDMYRKRKVV